MILRCLLDFKEERNLLSYLLKEQKRMLPYRQVLFIIWDYVTTRNKTFSFFNFKITIWHTISNELLISSIFQDSLWSEPAFILPNNQPSGKRCLIRIHTFFFFIQLFHQTTGLRFLCKDFNKSSHKIIASSRVHYLQQDFSKTHL